MTDITGSARGPDLLPCPFCGSHNLGLIRHTPLQRDRCVMCRDCKCSSISPDRWNRRADLAPDPLGARVAGLLEALDREKSLIWIIENTTQVRIRDLALDMLQQRRAALTEYRAAREAITRGTPPAFATSA
jgi:hypothetical protein